MRMESPRLFLLESNEGQAFLVDEHVAFQSPLVRRQVEKAGGVLLLEGADTRSLRKVLEWCKMHTPERRVTVPPDVMRKWEHDYVDPRDVPFRLVDVVCYMELTELEDWLSNRIADAEIFAGRDSVEVRGQLLRGIRGGSSERGNLVNRVDADSLSLPPPSLSLPSQNSELSSKNSLQSDDGSMTEGRPRVYLLESNEGQAFLVDEDVAMQSKLVRREAEKAGGIILLKMADTESLRKVIEWCKMHTVEKRAALPPEEIRRWEEDFIDPWRVPFTLVHAVCYMELRGLEVWLMNRMADAAIAYAGRDPVEMGRQVRARIMALELEEEVRVERSRLRRF